MKKIIIKEKCGQKKREEKQEKIRKNNLVQFLFFDISLSDYFPEKLTNEKKIER